ncbi:MAG: right-handed parallel beta-helix repeat-containing protein [Candidatus Lokiarchaeota archaeon]|nr:right-handed parallel beta-helix repeat-containing protein [Candidatus Lokiarchaeota archaeon]
MTKFKLKKKILCFILIIVPNIIALLSYMEHNNTLNIEKESNFNNSLINNSAINESPIFINGTATGMNAKNWTWAEKQTWCSGLGTIESPYIIKDLAINGEENSIPIHIINSEKYFNISNCYLYNSIYAQYSNLTRGGIVLENVKNGLIYSNNCSDNNGHGISILNSSSITIQSNILDSNIWGGLRLDTCINSIILNNIIENSNSSYSYGIIMKNCNYSTVCNNDINYVREGFCFLLGNDYTIEGNTLKHIRIQYNAIYTNSENVKIKNNFIKFAGYRGIYLDKASLNATIEGNHIEKGQLYGICVNGENISIYNNTVIDFSNNIYLEECEQINCTNNDLMGSTIGVTGIFISTSGGLYIIDGNNMTNCGIYITPNKAESNRTITTSNKLNGRTIYHYYNRTGLNTLDFTYKGDPGQIIVINCNNSEISEFNISNTMNAIPIIAYYCYDLIIYNNILVNNSIGIIMKYSYFPNITENIISFNKAYGIDIMYCKDVSIVNNSIYNNDYDGIYFDCSSISFINNTIYENGENGIINYLSTNIEYIILRGNTIIHNHWNGIFLLLNNQLEISNNLFRDNTFDGIHVSNSNYTTIVDNTIDNNGENGIYLGSTTLGIIKNNTIKSNVEIGIYFLGVEGLSIYNNSILENNEGIHFTSESENNTIYLNNFTGNNINAINDGNNNQWDNGTIGNYWDDYSGRDINFDNIGDLPYNNIEGSSDSQDRYPICYNHDAPPPIWNDIPLNQTIELGNAFSYQLNAFSSFGIDHYSVNSTLFNTNSNGLITNASNLAVGEYWIEICVFDPYNQNCSAIIKISISDTTDPVWGDIKLSHIVMHGEDFYYDIDASDFSGIAYYWINNEEDFSIDNSTGEITNITTLEKGNYDLIIRAYDLYGNYCETTIHIIVDSEEDSIPGYDLLILFSSIGILSVILLLNKRYKFLIK